MTLPDDIKHLPRRYLHCAAVVLLVSLTACGNKGDLFLSSDIVETEELEDAAEKLKKKKPGSDASNPTESE